MHRRHVGGHWDSILMNVAFPLMCFSQQDAQLWEEDPAEYIRKVRAARMRLHGAAWAGMGWARLCRHVHGGACMGRA